MGEPSLRYLHRAESLTSTLPGTGYQGPGVTPNQTLKVGDTVWYIVFVGYIDLSIECHIFHPTHPPYHFVDSLSSLCYLKFG